MDAAVWTRVVLPVADGAAPVVETLHAQPAVSRHVAAGTRGHSIGDGAMKPVITTSWDDGHPFDLRTAELLANHGLKGTFYIPTNYSEWPLMTKSQIRELDAMGMEIGSHTKNHSVVPRLTKADAMRELVESRQSLEDLLSKPVPAFCFPKGKFSVRSCALAREAGYKLARTTVGFRTERNFDPACMP